MDDKKKPAREYPVTVKLQPGDADGALVTVPIQSDVVPGSAYEKGLRLRRAFGDTAEQAKGLVKRGFAPAVRALAPSQPTTAMAFGGLQALGSQDTRVAIRDAIDGFLGNPQGGKKLPVQSDKPVEQALAQGRAAGGPPAEITPAERQAALISAILGSNLTVNEAGAVAGLAGSGIPGANAKVSAKDTVMTQAAQLSEAIYAGQLKQAQQLAQTDPAGAKALEMKATTEHWSRQAGLVGLNPLQIAQAELMNSAAEE